MRDSSGNELLFFFILVSGKYIELLKISGWDQKVSQISDYLFAFELVHYYCVFLLADEDDLRDMISAVTSLAGRWKDLGISLGVRASDLDTILANNPHSSNNCLREVLSLWLRQDYNVCTTLM